MSFISPDKLKQVIILLILLCPLPASAEVLREVFFDFDGKVVLTFYIKGKKIARQVWSNNGETVKTTGIIPNGTVKQQYADGSIWEITYKNNLAEGTSKVYTSNGKLRVKSKYHNGKLNGVCKIYSPKGKVTCELLYKNGVLVKKKEYDDRGNTIQEEQYTPF